MPDISMCMGGKCALKDTCYRFKATPDENHQSYFLNPPFKKEGGEHVCKYYTKMYNVSDDGVHRVVPKKAYTTDSGARRRPIQGKTTSKERK